MTVALLEGPSKGKRVAVTREAFEAWLGTGEKIHFTDRVRIHLMMLLGRMEPDRDLKRGIQQR